MLGAAQGRRGRREAAAVAETAGMPRVGRASDDPERRSRLTIMSNLSVRAAVYSTVGGSDVRPSGCKTRVTDWRKSLRALAAPAPTRSAAKDPEA